MKRIIELSENDYMALKEDGVQNYLALADTITAHSVIYEERPQGEWIESHICSCGKILRMGMDVIEHKCKNCGRWSIKWARTIPDSFCSNCGAEIKKGGKE